VSTRSRAALLAASIVILVVAFIALRPSDDATDTSNSTAETTPTATATASPAPTEQGVDDAEPTPTSTPTPEPTPDPGPLLTTAKVTKIRVKKGETVRFRARSSKPEEIHVHGYDLSRDVAPGKTARMSFKATIDGIFEIEFEKSATQIAELRVDP
jgi:hypothetical protein